jgi:hypothetical protein
MQVRQEGIRTVAGRRNPLAAKGWERNKNNGQYTQRASLSTQLAAALRLFRALNHTDGSEDTEPRTVKWTDRKYRADNCQECQLSRHNSSYTTETPTYQRRVLLGKLIVARQLKKLSAVYRTRMLLILPIGTSH